MRAARASPTFWLLCAPFYVCGASSNGIVGQHFMLHAVDHGFTAYVAAGALAIVGAFNFVGTIASGWLTDRLDPRRRRLVYYVLRGVSLIALPFVHEGVGLVAFSVLLGLDHIATVPPMVVLAADTFGRRNVGVVYGWIFAAHRLGAAMRRSSAGGEARGHDRSRGTAPVGCVRARIVPFVPPARPGRNDVGARMPVVAIVAVPETAGSALYG